MSPEVIDPSPDTLRAAPSVPPEADPAPSAAPTDQATPKAEEELDEEGKPKRMGGFQKRISKLNARLVEKDEQLAAREEEIARLKAGNTSPAAADAPKPSAKPEPPDEDKFTSYAEFKAAERKYMEDLADWKAEEKFKTLKAKEQEEATKAKEKEKAEETQKTWATRLEAAHEAHPDLEDLLEDDLPATPAMVQTVQDSEHGGELLYYLASHPEECRRIAQLAPLSAARELGRIEDRISKPIEPAKAPEAQRKTTSAPAPLQPLKGTGTATKDPSKLSDSEWMRAQRSR